MLFITLLFYGRLCLLLLSGGEVNFCVLLRLVPILKLVSGLRKGGVSNGVIAGVICKPLCVGVSKVRVLLSFIVGLMTSLEVEGSVPIAHIFEFLSCVSRP